MVVYVCHLSYAGGIGRKIMVWGCPWAKTCKKRDGGMAQVVEHCLVSVRSWVPKPSTSRVPVAHTYNPSYSGGGDQEDLGLKPARANSSWDPVSNKPITEKGWQGGSTCRPLVQTPVPQKKKKKSPVKKIDLKFVNTVWSKQNANLAWGHEEGREGKGESERWEVRSCYWQSHSSNKHLLSTYCVPGTSVTLKKQVTDRT
jgi:hypothetical protein